MEPKNKDDNKTDFDDVIFKLSNSIENLNKLNLDISQKVAKINDYREPNKPTESDLKEDNGIIGKLYSINKSINYIINIATETNNALNKIV